MELRLARIRIKDAAAFCRCINDQEIMTKTFDEAFDLPFSEQDAAEYIRRCRKDKESPEFSILIDDRFVGSISLDRSESDDKSYEIGYFVDRDHWGKGIASKAIVKALDYGFRRMNAEKITGEVFLDNPASVKVLIKAGFTFSHKSPPKKVGQPENIHYIITKEQYLKQVSG